MRYCLQCCSVWSLLDRCSGLTECLAEASVNADALAEVVEAIGAKVKSDEWRANEKRNLATALSVQEIWFFRVLYAESDWSLLWAQCFVFDESTDLFQTIRKLL